MLYCTVVKLLVIYNLQYVTYITFFLASYIYTPRFVSYNKGCI